MATVIEETSAPSTAAVPTVSPATPDPMSALTLYRMSGAIYEQIAELGLLGPDDKVVLLDGILVNQMTKGHRHGAAVLRGQEALRAAIPAGWHVRPEQAVSLRGGPDGDSVPEPDLAVALGTIGSYDEGLPSGPDLGLVVEVCSTPDAVRIDRAGLSRYAHAGIPIACIVNIIDRSVEVHTDPSGPVADARYRAVATLRPGQFLEGEIGNAATGPAALAPVPVDAFFAPI